MVSVNESKRVVFLCSGGGANLSFTQHAIQRGWLSEFKIVGVLTDRQCLANDFSNRIGLYNRVIEFKDDGQNILLSQLDDLKPDLIVTTVHKIIGPEVVERYQNKLINLHYSLLPAFSGLIGTRPVNAALDHRVLFCGVTVHLVNEDVDAGRPLVQGVIAFQNEETLESLMPVVFRCGCLALLSTLTGLLSSSARLSSPIRLDVLGRTCLFNGGGAVPERLESDESFWKQVQKSLLFNGARN